MHLAMKKLLLLPAIFLFACSTSGPVDTTLNDLTTLQVVVPPRAFHSDIDELTIIQAKLQNRSDWSSPQYQALIQKEDELISEIERVQSELVQTGGIQLDSGKSYSFNVQSFCVYPGQARPVVGDGYRLGEITGSAQKWLPEILEKLPEFSLNQNQVQNLIWQLLTGAHYDELGAENQRIIGLFFNHPVTVFGSSAVSSVARNIFDSVLPSEISSKIETFQNLKGTALSLQNDFKSLENAFSPKSDRAEPLPVGWMRMKEGFLIKVTSHGYQESRIDIYVPEDGRSPQSKKTIKISKLIALPAAGQRLALSQKINLPKRTINNQYCKKLSEFKPQNCHEITDKDRAAIIQAASPGHFPQTMYRSPPDFKKSIEAETDCSRFVQQIYERAGKQYSYSSTSTFECLSVFQEVRLEERKPGDMVLYKGHIGVLSKKGYVISATRGGVNEKSKLNPNEPDFIPSITELPIDEFGKYKIVKWRCP